MPLGIANSDDLGTSLQAGVCAKLTAGTTYFFLVGSGRQPGTLVLPLLAVPRPHNDDSDQAIPFRPHRSLIR